MQASNFSLAQYCKRIGFNGVARPDLETVAGLMTCQLYTVPFENLDVQAGKIVSLVPEEIVDKIVHRQRGGYCYEVNGLFAMALEALGVEYTFVAARPMFYPMRRPKTHMAIIVTIGGQKWLCDLGFGAYGIRKPLSLSLLDVEVKQDQDIFKLSKLNQRDYLLQARVENEWSNQYSFDDYGTEWIDFSPANYLNSTHPDAVFVQKLLIVLHNESGRKILLGDSLKIVANGKIEKQSVSSAEHAEILFRHFNLVAP